jgi:hypothetical protein
VTLSDNTMYGWRGGIKFNGDDAAHLSNIRVTRNLVQDGSDEKPLVRHFGPADPGRFTYERNVYHSRSGAGRWFEIEDVHLGFAEWVPSVEEEGAEAREVAFADAGRTIETYHAALGGEPSLEAFMAEARRQAKSNWRTAYGAGAIIEWFEAGFTPVSHGGVIGSTR